MATSDQLRETSPMYEHPDFAQYSARLAAVMVEATQRTLTSAREPGLLPVDTHREQVVNPVGEVHGLRPNRRPAGMAKRRRQTGLFRSQDPARRVRLMSEPFYSDARLYDLLFPGGKQAVDFYRGEADRQGGCVLELGCGTGCKLIPIASDGHPCMGLELSPDMLAEAQRKADERGVEVEWVQGDMREFHLGRTFELVFIAANSLLHLHEAEDLVDCFRSVRRHLAPGARLTFDVFNPSVRMLAQADGVRRRRDALSFVDPDRGVVHVDVAETYDAAAQVTRGRWYFSTDSEADFVVAPLEIRSIFPQELPLLLSLGGLRVVERFGDWSRASLTADAALQLYICEPG
jgi:SAM-dependent methyltransferase